MENCHTATANLNGTIPLNNQIPLKGTIGAAGFSGGTSNYEKLKNKPSINGTELIGNLELGDLGIKRAFLNGIELDEDTTLDDVGSIPISNDEIQEIIDEVFK